MPVAVRNQTAEPLEQRNPPGVLIREHPIGGESTRRLSPRIARTVKLIVERTKRYHAHPTALANPVESFHFEEASAPSIHHARAPRECLEW